MTDDVHFSAAGSKEKEPIPSAGTLPSGNEDGNAIQDSKFTLPGHATPSLVTVPKVRIGTAHRSKDPMHLPIGEMYADFFIVGELGRGTFGVVYLAEQISLKRTVALKVTDATRDDGCGFEGRTMAQLEHPSIVRIYQELNDDTNQRRLLCMQYVSGINLRRLISKARARHGDRWNGRQLLAILNEGGIAQQDAVLQDTSLADRAVMESADKLATVCWMGSQAAFALDHAHHSGYIHRDVKPANTIINRFGRPMLVDFNLALESEDESGRGMAGGTLPYMSPESLRAFAMDKIVKTTNVADADVYALGVMLWELSCGEFPFETKTAEAFGSTKELKGLIDSRRIQPHSDLVDPKLADVLRRAFHFDPHVRYRTAREFGETLQGITQQANACKARNPKSPLGRSVVNHPKSWLLIAGFLPHVIASVFQIAYNQAEIVDRLNPQAHQLFNFLLFGINPIVYGICAVLAINRMFSVLRPGKLVAQGESPSPDIELGAARQDLLSFPRYVAVVGGLGWVVAAIAFPAIIYFMAQQFEIEVWLHFIGSFAISGAMAVNLSYSLVLAVVVYAIYPDMFDSPIRFSSESKQQLGPLRMIWPKLSAFAGGIPLAAVILLVANFRPADLLPSESSHYQEFAFKSLVIGLILASVFGFEFVRRIGQAITRLIDRCTGNGSHD